MIKFDKEKFKNFNFDSNKLYIITDFDNTITDGNSVGSLNVITESSFVGDEYRHKYTCLVKKYKSKITSDMKYSLKQKIWNKHLKNYFKMFRKYKLTQNLLEKIVKNSNIKIRKNFDVFLKFLNKNKIPVIIVSSGFGNTIETFLKINNLYYDNIYIISNFVVFDDNGRICKIPKKIITPTTKNKIKFDKKLKKYILNRKNKLIIGDVPDDIGMSKINKSHDTISIAFCNSNNNKDELLSKFDIVIKDKDIIEILKELIDGVN